MVVVPGAQLCTLLEVWVLGVGMSTLGVQTALYAEYRGLQVPMTLEHGPVTSRGKSTSGPDPRIRQRIQIDMFRSIRVDHTNCLQVVIKTHSFNSVVIISKMFVGTVGSIFVTWSNLWSSFVGILVDPKQIMYPILSWRRLGSFVSSACSWRQPVVKFHVNWRNYGNCGNHISLPDEELLLDTWYTRSRK